MKDYRYIKLIAYQNELIARFLGYENKGSLLIRIMCSEASLFFSTSIHFSKKLKYALDYMYDNDQIAAEDYQKYEFFRTVYHSKLNLFQIKKIQLPI